MRLNSALVLTIPAFLGLSSCVSSRPYQVAELGPRPTLEGGRLPVSAARPSVPKICSSSTACIAFVEFDDYGNLMNRAQLQSTVQAADETARSKGTVLVYVHGWHNDANDGSRDVVEFKRLVQRASEVDSIFRPLHPGRGQIFGIYVGWRGDSISSEGVAAPLSNLLTFWDRKNAAHDIGASGGVYELFARLSDLRREHLESRLIIHGHSFGGALVYSTLAHTLMDQIRRDAEESTELTAPVADLVLLVNPAFEAIKLRPQLDLARSQEYKANLPPRLVIVTTKADWATRLAFPFGRFLSTLTDAYADEQSSSENRQAVGHYLPYITHQLSMPLLSDCSLTQGIPVQSLEAVQREDRATLCFQPLVYPDARPLELRRCDQPGWCSMVAGSHYIARGKAADGMTPFRLPILNIRTTDHVNTGHTDIRNKTFENFVVQLMALAVRDPESLPMAPMPMLPVQ